MLTPQHLHQYQRECIMHQLTHDQSMLWLGMGLGKTPITLTTIVDRMRTGQVQKTLVFAPLRVIQSVWAKEARKWEHTKHLRFSIVHGTKVKRSQALFAPADVYLINYEAMNWLAETLDHYYLSQNKPLPFQMVVYDEISKLKNSTALRMKGGNRDRKDKHGTVHKIRITGWRKMIPYFRFSTGLTGTPASNGYLDLHGQYLALDNGARLGEYITRFRDNYFQSDFMGWSYSPTEIGKHVIEQKISDVTVKMDSKDYLDLPAVKVTDLLVTMPDKARQAYEEVERDMFARLDNGDELEVFSRSSVSNKCLQIANGSPYLEPGQPEYTITHDAKLDALEEVLEEAAGSSVLCSYSFKADADRIMKRFKKFKPVNLTAELSRKTEGIIDKWNHGEIKLMIGHPACLHADTQVLTERNGWTKIVEVLDTDRVFDGVEFVEHSGCRYSGTKEVIECCGMVMTPDHQLLVDDQWMEAQDVRNSKISREKAVWGEVQAHSDCQMRAMFYRVEDVSAECDKAQSGEQDSLQELRRRPIPSSDKHPNMANMARNEAQSTRHDGQELRGSWYNYRPKLGKLFNVLSRYVLRLFRQHGDREDRRKQSVLQEELHVGDCVQSTIKQENNPEAGVQRKRDSSSGACSRNRDQQNDADHATEQGYDRGRSSERRVELFSWEEPKEPKPAEKRIAKVYDLVDCGSRHRFMIRNSKGELFLSHNSMGHGVDGLQESGHIVVWFGLNWSLELYEQMNARIDRQGQRSPVSIIRILCTDTVDQAVADALERKTGDQQGLKDALQRYRFAL